MSSSLERRCRTLLHAYPRWYRRVRGDEMLATLLEAGQPGQSWPSARDARALIIGGLRVRATRDTRLTTAANLRLAAQLGAVLTLLLMVSGSLNDVVMILAHTFGRNVGVGYWPVYGLLGLATVVAAWFAPRPVVAALAAAAGAAAFWLYWSNGRVLAILPAGLLALLVVLVSFGERMPRSWLWLAGVVFAANLLPALVPLAPLFLYASLIFVPWVIVGAVIFWAFVDARPLMAMAIFIACAYPLSNVVAYLGSGGPVADVLSWPLLVYGIIAVVLASGSFWGLRRQAVL